MLGETEFDGGGKAWKATLSDDELAGMERLRDTALPIPTPGLCEEHPWLAGLE